MAKDYVRLTGYEKEFIKLECAVQYKNVLMYCFEEIMGQILQLKSFEQLQKEEGFKIIIGDYMGHGIVAYGMPVDIGRGKAGGGGNGLFSDQ